MSNPPIISGPPIVAIDTPSDTAANPNIEYRRAELVARMPEYELIADVLAGELTVKARGVKYLPKPNAADVSTENVARYDAYKTRAVFYNVARRTLAGLSGQVFAKEPNVKVPKLLEIVVKDATGGGITLTQVAKDAEDYVLGFGRAGLLADYPETNGPATLAQQQSGDVRPTITVYAPFDITNWRTITREARILLSLVVLREAYDTNDDGFETKAECQYRVLRLVNNIYNVEIWRKDKSGKFSIYTTTQPRDGKGNVINEIPFTFIGATNNDATVDESPMYDICSLNIAHYRNSADYEESCFITGQATPVLSGLTEAWVKEVLEDKVELGSRAAIPLPVGGSATLLQMAANSAPYEAMQHKENQMVALGAKLVQNKSVQRTATEAGLDSAAETSILASATNNVSAAVQWGLEWCAIFMDIVGINDDARSKAVTFELNTDFTISNMAPDQQNAVINAWQKNALSFSEMRSALRQSGLATQTDQEAIAEIEAANLVALQNEIKTQNALSGGQPNAPFTPNNTVQ